MKKVIFTLAAPLVSLAAFCQEPTTLKEQNLKGKVFCVTYSKYEYKENFGEPQEGKLEEFQATFYDDQGRSILIRKKEGGHYGEIWPYSYPMSYSKEGDNTKVKIFYVGSDKTMPAESFLENWKDTNMALENKYVEGRWPQECSEITYDANGVIIKWDKYSKLSASSKQELTARRIATKGANNTYECKIYASDGGVGKQFTETYVNGKLTSLVEQRSMMHNLPIKSSEPGKYEYNKDGQLVKFSESKKSLPLEYIYNRNEHGDITIINSGQIGKGEKYRNVTQKYDNYKYDNQGNWIYRTIEFNNQVPQFIEKREIIYCNSVEDIKEKGAFVSSIVSKVNDRDAVDAFYGKYLDRQFFEAKMPLPEYDTSYAKQKGADKMTVVIRVSFESGGKCSYSRRLEYSSNVPFKMYKLVEEWNSNSDEKYRYVIKDGIITMNNEQYKIDPNTGNLTNITKNLQFSKRIF